MFMWARSPSSHVRYTHNSIALPSTAAQSQRNSKDAHVAALASSLKHCDTLSLGRQVHDFIIKQPRYAHNTFLCNFLMEMYGRFGRLDEAQYVFDHMPKPNLHSWNILLNVCGQNSNPFEASSIFGRMPIWDIVSWTSIIMTFSQHGHSQAALNLYSEMLMLAFVPNKITFLCSLEACSSLHSLVQGQDIHIEIVKYGYEKDRDLGTMLVSLYGKCGCLSDALIVFRGISDRDVALWNAMTGSIIHNGEHVDALSFIQKMHFEGFNPDHVSFVSFLDACRSLDEGLDTHALVVFFGLEQNAMINNSLITIKEALDLFCRMQLDGVMPDKATFLCILTAFDHDGEVDNGKHFFYLLIRDFILVNNKDHFLCMVDLLGRAGLLDEAEVLIKEAPAEIASQASLCLLGACKIHGDIERGSRVAGLILSMDANIPSVHVMIYNLYAAIG